MAELEKHTTILTKTDVLTKKEKRKNAKSKWPTYLVNQCENTHHTYQYGGAYTA